MIAIREVMSHPVETIELTATVFEAAKLMAQLDLGFLPVVHEGVSVGVVTDRDLVIRVMAEGLDPQQTLLSAVLSTDHDAGEPSNIRVDSIDQDMPISEAIEFMDQKGIRRVIVHDTNEQIVGVVSRADLSESIKGVHE